MTLPRIDPGRARARPRRCCCLGGRGRHLVQAAAAGFASSCHHRRPMKRLRREGRRLGERWAVLTCGLSCGEAQGCKLHTIEKPRANGPWLARRPPDHDNRIRVASPSGSFRWRPKLGRGLLWPNHEKQFALGRHSGRGRGRSDHSRPRRRPGPRPRPPPIVPIGCAT
jgi:hypothetical protein